MTLAHGLAMIPAMSRAFRIRLRRFLILTAMTAAFGFLTTLGRNDIPSDARVAVLTEVTLPWTLGGGIFWWFEVFFVPSRYGAFLRRQHFGIATALKTGFVLIAAFLAANLTYPIFHGTVDPLTVARELVEYQLAAILISIPALSAVLHVIRVMGVKTFMGFMAGRYMRPVREETIFLFLDLADSTRMAEHMGDEGVQALIARFFFDISTPIADHGGQVHRYVGDQVVVTWPLRSDPQRNADPLRCCQAIAALMAREAEDYRRLFGWVPCWRIGLHGGSVVIAQLGDQKQELSYFGDTVNTAARVQGQCKSLGADILITEELLAQLTLPDGMQSTTKGCITLRGRDAPAALAAVDLKPD